MDQPKDDKPLAPQVFFPDQDKSWKDTHKLERLIRLKVQTIQKNAHAMVVETDEVIALVKELYPKLPKTDGTLFGISPLAPNKIIEALMEHMLRAEGQERNFSRRIKASKIIDFSKKFTFEMAIDEALAWAFKLEKSDLDKIV